MVSGSSTDEFSSPVVLERLWRAGILDTHNLIPKIAHDYIKSIEIIEGDGGIGTVKKFNFTEDTHTVVKFFSSVTDRVEVLDNENHIFKYTIIDGGLIGLRLKSYSFEVKLKTNNDGGCNGEVTLEYETLDDTDLSEEEKIQIKDGVFKMMKGVEEFLIANPNTYT